MNRTRPKVCSPSQHERLKRDSSWPKLEPLGIQVLGDIELEMRNCECGSTLCREVKK